MIRAAYYPDIIDISNLDIYLLFKLGYAFGSMEDSYYDPSGGTTAIDVSKEPSGFGVGLAIGARYYFGNRFGIFTELGYERFFTNFKGEAW